jgi:hypothetical protein
MWKEIINEKNGKYVLKNIQQVYFLMGILTNDKNLPRSSNLRKFIRKMFSLFIIFEQKALITED